MYVSSLAVDPWFAKFPMSQTTQRLDAISRPHSQQGRGVWVPLLLQVHDLGSEAFIEQTEGLANGSLSTPALQHIYFITVTALRAALSRIRYAARNEVGACKLMGTGGKGGAPWVVQVVRLGHKSPWHCSVW